MQKECLITFSIGSVTFVLFNSYMRTSISTLTLQSSININHIIVTSLKDDNESSGVFGLAGNDDFGHLVGQFDPITINIPLLLQPQAYI